MRKIEKIMNQWLFTERSGEKILVDLPHTWNNIDGQDGGNDYYRGTFVYEKIVSAPKFDKEKEVVYLVFEGVNSSAKVNVNDKEVITHDGGYSTFRVDVTELLQDENKISVEVDNSVSDKVYPQRADFTFYGGIYRDVYFLVVSKHHFDLDHFGGPGIKVTPKVEDKVAIIEGGRLVENGTVEEIFANPKSKAARKLIYGNESKNIININENKDMNIGKKLRIVFSKNSAFEPVIANMILHFQTAINILQADTKDVAGRAVGEMIIGLPMDKHIQVDMEEYLKQSGLQIQEVE